MAEKMFIFHFVNITHFIYLFVHQLIDIGLFTPFGYIGKTNEVLSPQNKDTKGCASAKFK